MNGVAARNEQVRVDRVVGAVRESSLRPFMLPISRAEALQLKQFSQAAFLPRKQLRGLAPQAPHCEVRTPL